VLQRPVEFALPHLNFQGQSGRLDRDLYLNIIGRAGRASVAVEGMVFILDSDAKTLSGLVRQSLWSTTQKARVTSALPSVTSDPVSIETYSDFRAVQSQLLAWIVAGTPRQFVDGSGTHVNVVTTDDQIDAMAARTFASESAESQSDEVRHLIASALEDLENAALIVARSPYAATSQGSRVALTGLSYVSAKRLTSAFDRIQGDWITDIYDANKFRDDQTDVLAHLAFEAEEVLRESLWLRRAASTSPKRLLLMRELADGQTALPEDDENFQADLNLLSGWLSGESYEQLAARAPTFTKGLFGGSDPHNRASDAAEYIGRIAYSAWQDPLQWCHVNQQTGSFHQDTTPTRGLMPHHVRIGYVCFKSI
jgi:hypothetical protein